MGLRTVLGLSVVAASLVAAEGRAANLCSLQNGGADSIRLLNLSTGGTPSELRLGTLTGGTTLSADRRRLFAPTTDGLAVVDVRRLRVVDTVPIAVGGLIVATADDVVYFVAAKGSRLVLRAIDVQRRTARDVVELPYWAERSSTTAIGDAGRLLYVTCYANDGTTGVAAIDLAAARLVGTWVSPSRTANVVAAPHPTRPFAYLVERTWHEQDRVLKWYPGTDPTPLPLPPGQVVFALAGSRAYLVRNAELDTAERTLLIDTSNDTVLDEIPSGTIVGFADAQCVVLANGRELRRACPGAGRSQAIDGASLARDDLVLVDHNAFAAPVWTDGPCETAPAVCDDGVSCLEVLGATALAGESVDVAVRLHTAGVAIPGVQNDLFLERPLAVSAARPDQNGQPVSACRVNPEIGKEQSVVTCLEARDGECRATRALVLSLFDVDPIADGAVLYHCEVTIPETAGAGRYRLGCTTAAASDVEGNAVPIRCQDGELVVTRDSGTNAQTGGGAADGCQIAGAGAPSHAAPRLLPVLALLALRFVRRRERPGRDAEADAARQTSRTIERGPARACVAPASA